MATEMDISRLDKKEFRIKGRSGTITTFENGVKIESSKDGSSKELNGAGEYEVAGISVIGVKNDGGVVFVYEVDGIRICHFGIVKDVLSEGKLTQVGDIAVLLLPISSRSIEIMQQIEGYYILPYGYDSEVELDKFLKDSGFNVQRLPKLLLKKEEMIEDQTSEIIVLDSN